MNPRPLLVPSILVSVTMALVPMSAASASPAPDAPGAAATDETAAAATPDASTADTAAATRDDAMAATGEPTPVTLGILRGRVDLDRDRCEADPAWSEGLFVMVCARFQHVGCDGRFAIPLSAPTCGAQAVHVAPDGRVSTGGTRFVDDRIDTRQEVVLDAPDGEHVSVEELFRREQRSSDAIRRHCLKTAPDAPNRSACLGRGAALSYGFGRDLWRALPRMQEALGLQPSPGLPDWDPQP